MDFTNLKNFLDHMAAERTPGNVVEVYLDGKKSVPLCLRLF